MQITKKELAERIAVIPGQIENLKAQYNQYLGYQQALDEVEEDVMKEPLKEKKAK